MLSEVNTHIHPDVMKNVHVLLRVPLKPCKHEHLLVIFMNRLVRLAYLAACRLTCSPKVSCLLKSTFVQATLEQKDKGGKVK